jgi:predicted Zn-dependent protease
MGLRVSEPDEVLAQFAAWDREGPASGLVPSYRAELLLWLGRTAAAASECEEAIRREPLGRWAWIGLAQARMWQGEFGVAAMALENLERRLPNLPTLAAALGELSFLRRDWGRAEGFLRRAVEAHPTRRSAWILLGLTLLERGQRTAAESILSGLRRVAPDVWRDVEGDVGAQLRQQLRWQRGNRSSGFVTLFPDVGPPMLLEGEHLSPPVELQGGCA